MEIQIKSTDVITEIDGVPVRLWEGTTAAGVKCKVFVHRLAVHQGEDAGEFARELREMLRPGRKIPLNQVL